MECPKFKAAGEAVGNAIPGIFLCSLKSIHYNNTKTLISDMFSLSWCKMNMCHGWSYLCIYIYICMLLIIFRFMWEHETPLSRKDALLLSRCFWVCWGAWLAMNSPASSLALRPAPHDLALSLLVRAPGGFVGSDIARPSGELLVSGMRCTHIDMLILMMMMMMMMTTTTAIHISYSNSPK